MTSFAAHMRAAHGLGLLIAQLTSVCRLQGRHVLWGWLQERRKAGSYDYSGCMTVPRLLYLEDERLIQVEAQPGDQQCACADL